MASRTVRETSRGDLSVEDVIAGSAVNGGAAPGGGADLPGRDRLLTPGEVAQLFRVDPKTVTRWAAAGRINSIRTPGGHRRFRETEVRALLAGGDAVPPQPDPGEERVAATL